MEKGCERSKIARGTHYMILLASISVKSKFVYSDESRSVVAWVKEWEQGDYKKAQGSFWG